MLGRIDIILGEYMNDIEPKFYRRKDAEKRENVAWNPPAERAQQVYTHTVVCENCGREFTVESLMPIPPKFCLKGDEDGCYLTRKAAYQRALRAKKRGDASED